MALTITHWLIAVWRDVDPSALGPFETVEAQIAEAKRLRASGEMSEEDGLYWLDIEGDEPHVGSFDEMTFEEEA